MEMQVEMQGCSRCKKNLSINEFPIKKNGKGHKKTCSVCEEKTKRKETMNDRNNDVSCEVTIEEDKNKEKKKERRPSASTNPGKWLQEEILSEQNHKCRGPNAGECEWYTCPVNKSNMLLIFDGPDPEFDHIIPLENSGTNNIQNLQALCGCCHNKKTKCEGLMRTGNKTQKVLETYKYLSIPKYQNEEGEEKGDKGFTKVTFTDSDSDSDYDDIFEYRKKLMN